MSIKSLEKLKYLFPWIPVVVSSLIVTAIGIIIARKGLFKTAELYEAVLQAVEELNQQKHINKHKNVWLKV